MKLFFPDSEWEVGFTYITEPFAAAKFDGADVVGSSPQFKNGSEVQNFLITHVATETQWENSVIATISVPVTEPLVIDIALFMENQRLELLIKRI